MPEPSDSQGNHRRTQRTGRNQEGQQALAHYFLYSTFQPPARPGGNASPNPAPIPAAVPAAAKFAARGGTDRRDALDARSGGGPRAEAKYHRADRSVHCRSGPTRPEDRAI